MTLSGVMLGFSFTIKATFQLGDHSFQIGGCNVWDFTMIVWDVVRCYVEDLALPGQTRADQGRPRQTRAGQGKPGQARAGQGRPGQARAEQGRAGQTSADQRRTG